MDEHESLNHSKWECKYHVVFIPKCRRKTLYVQLRQYLGEIFRRLAEQKESRIEEGHLMSDHVHMMISIPPKYAVSQVIGFIKGKSAIHLARVYGETDGILSGRASGREGITHRRLGGMRRSYGTTFGTRNRRINDWSR
jgi:putative transposase